MSISTVTECEIVDLINATMAVVNYTLEIIDLETHIIAEPTALIRFFF